MTPFGASVKLLHGDIDLTSKTKKQGDYHTWVAIAVLHLSPRRAFCSPCLCRARLGQSLTILALVEALETFE